MRIEDHQNSSERQSAVHCVADGCFLVRRSACATCIYRKDSPLDLEYLEDEIRDPRGGFHTYRICNHGDTACCRGFWTRHKDAFMLGQLAQRLRAVRFVDE